MIVRDLAYGASYIKRMYVGRQMIYLRGAHEIELEATMLSDNKASVTLKTPNFAASCEAYLTEVSNVTARESSHLALNASLFTEDDSTLNSRPADKLAFVGAIEADHIVYMEVIPGTLQMHIDITSNNDMTLNADGSSAHQVNEEAQFKHTARAYGQSLMPIASADLHIVDSSTASSNKSNTAKAVADMSSANAMALHSQDLMNVAFENAEFDDSLSVTRRSSHAITADGNVSSCEDAVLIGQSPMSMAYGDAQSGSSVIFISSNIVEPGVNYHTEIAHDAVINTGNTSSNIMCVEFTSDANVHLTKIEAHNMVAFAEILSGSDINVANNYIKYIDTDTVSGFEYTLSPDTIIWLHPAKTNNNLYISQAYKATQTENTMEVK